ncbi:MAG TPA: ATP-binding protein [Polyangiaceae bacterium]|nr:ATP-binding protein [Polyangiaceae bacterium]
MSHRAADPRPRRLFDYVVLPREISPFEAAHLRHLNGVALWFFAAHVPIMTLVAWLNGTGPWLALGLTSSIAAGPALARASFANPRATSMTCGVAAMFMGGVLVHVGQGPMQIEMHFYFFALLAMLTVFGNPLVVLASAVTVALHHLALWTFLPRSVFNYDATAWVVAVHTAFVVLESVAACFIARSFFDNVLGLEKLIALRTAELDARNGDMRLVLDHVAQGLATIDRAGILSVERSASLDAWFAPRAGETLFDVVERASPAFGDASRLGWTEVTAAVMPLAVTLEQMPRQLQVADRAYLVNYLPIGDGEEPDRFLVVVTDDTLEANRRRSERDRREEMALFERILGDRRAVLEFVDEGAAFVEAIRGDAHPDLPTRARALHTLKGNSAVLGFETLSALFHDLETTIVEAGDRAALAGAIAPLQEHWTRFATQAAELTGGRSNTIEIDPHDLANLERGIRHGLPAAALLEMLACFELEPTRRRLERLGRQAERLADRLGRRAEVRVDDGGLRVDPKRWAGFWSALVHPIRNAVAHGLEDLEERRAQKKPDAGQIALRTYLLDGSLVVEVSDDGRGMDWQSIARRARELGLPTGTEAEVRKALLSNGVSTAAVVSDVSGRGLGLGALHAATRELGGELEIDSQTHRGTTLRMRFRQDTTRFRTTYRRIDRGGSFTESLEVPTP